MPEPASEVPGLISEAAENASKYKWIDAASLYQEALRATPDQQERPRLLTLVGKCFFQGAFQAETRDSFKDLMKKAGEAYREAGKISSQTGNHQELGLLEGKNLYTEFWIEDDSEKRKGLLLKALSTAERASTAAAVQADPVTHAAILKDILTYRCESLTLAQDYTGLKANIEEALRVGEKAVSLHRNLDQTDLLVCMKMVLLLRTIATAFRVIPHDEGLRRALEEEVELKSIARKIGSAHALGLEAEASCMIAHELQGNLSRALKIAQEGLKFAYETRNKDFIGGATAEIAGAMFWAAIGEEDSTKKRELLESASRNAMKAYEILKIPLIRRGTSGALEAYAEANTLLATMVETDLVKKKELLQKAIDVSRQGLVGETEPGNIGNLSHSLSKALLFLAKLDVPTGEKSRLLEESLQLRQQIAKLQDTLMPPNTWDQGVSRNYLALIKAELASINPDRQEKIRLLESACSDMQKCLAICSISPTLAQIPVLAQYSEWYGDVALKLLDTSDTTDASKQATNAFTTAIGYRTKASHEGSIPSLRWKLARTYDLAGLIEDASQEFQQAADGYRAQAKRMQGCETCFSDMAYYMEAWSLIERARLHHADEQYLLAAEEYQKVSEALKKTVEWAPLSQHYLGCSYLEGGEALGRQERPDSSKESFNAAVRAFQESKNILAGLLKGPAEPERAKELRDWMDLDQDREKYSQARIQLEEAKLLDKTGAKEASSSKYRSASTAFKALMGEAHNEQAKSEFRTLSLFCDAWAKMKEAEANASPDLYASAAELFLETEKATRREKLRVLAMANASICKALEAGTRFRRTRDTGLYGEIKKQLEASADYYREAGFKNAADWTRATQRMFDALVYLTEAEVERDPRKKTEHYHLAEKNLQLAARLYGDAGFQAKRDEAQAHLERAKEEKALLLSPLDALAGNPVDSTVSVSPVSLVQDQALGLERFEEASIVGTMRVPARDVGVGSELTIELELANVGKTAATLMKLEDVFVDGLELDTQKSQIRLEGNFVDLKGKRLEYLKTHDLKIPLKARRKGSYHIRPRVMFVDERGKYKSYDFEPVALNVRELGISGWLKGPK